MPTFSILMSVYNDTTALKQAIESVLSQSFEDFEFLIVNDGSTNPEVNQIINSYQDARIILHDFKENQGLTTALNFLLTEAKGKYYARMDADDICLPERLSAQYDFMEQNPDVDICCSHIQMFEGVDHPWQIPNDDDAIKASILWGSPFPHPTVVFRASSVTEHSLQYNEVLYAEDYDLWTRCALLGLTFGSVEEVLLQYRVPVKKNPKKTNIQAQQSNKIATSYMQQAFSLEMKIDNYELLFKRSSNTFSEVTRWYISLRKLVSVLPSEQSKHHVKQKSKQVLDIYAPQQTKLLFLYKRLLAALM